MEKLDRAWVNCLRMWKWISRNLPDGFSEASNAMKQSVIQHLKIQWLRKNKFTQPLLNNCFFCEFNMNSAALTDCTKCPATLVEKGFCCMEDDFHYALDPINFYQRILKLSKRRRINV